MEAWVGIVDFAHKAYQSESGYEALLDETFRLGLNYWFGSQWELCVVVAFVDAMTLCCLVQPSGIVRRWRKRARRKRKRQAVLRAKQASLAKVEQEQEQEQGQGQGGSLRSGPAGGCEPGGNRYRDGCPLGEGSRSDSA